MANKGGKKLVKGGGKTFDLKSMDLQLHFAQKIMGKAQKLEKITSWEVVQKFSI